MRVQVALKMPNNIIRYQVFDGVEARISTRGVLQIFAVYNKTLLAEYPPESFVAWRYVAPPPQPTSRAGLLLTQHGG